MELSYIITFSGWFLGGFVNIVTGMGGPMIALPLMVLFMDFSLVILVACLLSVLTNILLVIRFWHYTDWKAVWSLELETHSGFRVGNFFREHAYRVCRLANVGWPQFTEFMERRRSRTVRLGGCVWDVYRCRGVGWTTAGGMCVDGRMG